MNIFVFEVKKLRFSILIWSLSLAAFLLLFMSFFPAFGGETEVIKEMLESYPEDFLAFFGMNSDLPFTQVMGYFALTFTFVMIPLSIQSAAYGFHILSVEERELTADFLLVKPVSRAKIYVSKLGASIVSILLTDVFLMGASFGSLYLFKENASVDDKGTLILLLSMIPFQLFFLSVGMFISVLVKKVSSVIAYSMSLGFAFYILSSLGSMISSDALEALTPFSHFDPNYILIHHELDTPIVFVSISIILLSFVGSYFFYRKRNIKSL